MKNLLAAVTVALGLSACGGMGAANRYGDAIWTLQNESRSKVSRISDSVVGFLKSGTEAELIEKSKTVVADDLRDPSSAQFRNVRVVDYQTGKVVCGEVNGKNAYGGYVGFSAFVAGTVEASLYKREPQYPDIERATNTGLVAACRL